MNNQAKAIKYFIAVEKLGDEILNDRQEIILLDKRRNHNREALRELSKSSHSKCWITVGTVLVKHDINVTLSLLEADQKQLNIDINKLKSDLRVKVNNLRDLEMLPPVVGSKLIPLSPKETEGLSKAGLFT